MIRDHGSVVRFHDDLKELLVPIDDVERHPENYNNGDVNAIAESIEINGMYRPVLVQQSTNWIIAGNHTYEALLLMGATQVPVVILEVDDQAARRIMVADNRTASLAMPDSGALVQILTKLAVEDVGLSGTGYQNTDLVVLEALAAMPVEHNEYGTWPTLTFTVHPRVQKAFKTMTREADTDPERFELLLRLAGWEGK